MTYIPEADRARIYELYDGIVTTLEDMAGDPDYEEMFDE